MGKRAFPPLPTRPQLVAVYPALFSEIFDFISDSHLTHYSTEMGQKWVISVGEWLSLMKLKISDLYDKRFLSYDDPNFEQKLSIFSKNEEEQGRIHGHQLRTGGQGRKCAFSHFSTRA